MNAFDRKAQASMARADARAAKLGSIIDATYKLARRIEIAATSYTDSGQFTAQDTLRAAAREVRHSLGTLERARDIASHRSWVTRSDGSVKGVELQEGNVI